MLSQTTFFFTFTHQISYFTAIENIIRNNMHDLQHNKMLRNCMILQNVAVYILELL